MARPEPASVGSGQTGDLAGRVGVITGGASGIGRGIASALAAARVDTVIADIDADRAEAAAAELRTADVDSTAAGCDVADRSSVEALAELAWDRFGHIDMVFNNAGVLGHQAACVEIDEATARATLDVNLMGVWHGCSVFGRRFIEQGTPANIVNTASENGLASPPVRAARVSVLAGRSDRSVRSAPSARSGERVDRGWRPSS